MPIDANGNYSLPPIYAATPGTVIRSTQHNTPLEDIRAALNNAIWRDGRVGWTGNADANGYSLTGLGGGVEDTDAANMAQLKGLLNNTTLTGITTVPDVTDWTKKQPVPAPTADARYIAKGGNNNGNFIPVAAGVNPDARVWMSYTNATGNIVAVICPTLTEFNTLVASLTTESDARVSGDNARGLLSGGNSWSGDQNVNGNLTLSAGKKLFIKDGNNAGDMYSQTEYYPSGSLSGLNAVTHLRDSNGSSLGWFAFRGADGTLVTNSGIVAFASSVTAETVARTTADANLQAEISAETSRATSAENNLAASKGNISGGNSWIGNQNVNGNVSVGSGKIISVSDSSGAGSMYLWPEHYTSGNLAGLNAVTHLLDSSGNPMQWMGLRGADGSVWTSGGGKLAYASQLPFSDTALRIQAFIASGTGEATVNFPTAFRMGTTPIVVPVINREPNAVSRFANIDNINSENNPNITNTGFTFQPVFVSGSAGTSTGQWTLQVIAIGYF